MLSTNRAIQHCHVQPFVDEDSAGASGQQIGRFHGSAIITQVMNGYDHSGVLHVLQAPSDDIRSYFAEIARSYAMPFLVALRDGLSDAAGDRLAAYAVGLGIHVDPAELAREIAALRQGFDAGFDAGLTELADKETRRAETPADERTEDDPTDHPGRHARGGGRA